MCGAMAHTLHEVRTTTNTAPSAPEKVLVMRLSVPSALVSCLLALSACAVDAEEDTGESSDAIATAAGFVYADAEQLKAPAPRSSSNPAIASVNVNTKLIAYCKSGNYLGSNVRSGFAMSYIALDDGDGVANVKRCLSKDGAELSCASFLAGLPACAAPAAAGSGSSSGGAAVALSPLAIPAGSLLVKRASLTRSGYFNEPVNVTRTANGTFMIGAKWNAYDGSGALIGRGSCPEGTYRADYTGIYDCWGSTSRATRFDVQYYALGTAARSAVVR
jgi:hypothetical protein